MCPGIPVHDTGIIIAIIVMNVNQIKESEKQA